VTRVGGVRRVVHSSLIVTCYVLWTAVLIGVAATGGLWVLGRVFGDGSDTSSAYEVISDNMLWLLVGSIVVGVVALALSWWIERHVD
jgi:hypothetical protein